MLRWISGWMMVVIPAIVVLTGPAMGASAPWLAEMPMEEPWHVLNDTPDIRVFWHSDVSAVLLLSESGAAALDTAGIEFEMIDRLEPGRDYYIVTRRTHEVPVGMSGTALRSGHFLGSVPRGTVLPGRRDTGYQRLRVRDRYISSLVPRVYTGYADRDYDPFIQTYVDQVQGSYLLSLLENMVAFQTRYSYTDGCVQATNWAASEFESWGYTTELFPHTSGMAPNVIAWKYGSENPDNIWVVGGHLDSISNNNPSVFAPGADDNGTGSGLTLCCANILKDLNFADTVVYALWTGEEQGLYGSDAWAEWAANQGLNIQGYYNFDMIGWVDPSPEDLDVLCNSASMSFGQDFVDVADMYTNLLHDLQQENVSASDHYSFWQQGYVAFCAIEDYWPTYPYYHTDQDTVDKVDIPFFTEVTKAMVANVCTAAQLAETMAMGQGTVNCSSLVDLMVIDFDATGSIIVTLSSDSEPGGEMVMLTETTNHLFEGTIQLTDAPPAGDGLLSVADGDTVTMAYGGVPGSATAAVDCTAPVITGVTVESITSQTATIAFNTSEMTHARVRYGIGTPSMETSGAAAGTSHTVTLTGLDDCTGYVFEVEAEDLAGNITVDDNGGALFSFTTMERLSMMLETMDSDPGWTVEGDWAWGQPTGQGGEYGNPDPTGGYTGNNVVGYNLNGDYPNSMSSTLYTTTGAIDCSGADGVMLTFYAWLGVEQDQYDHAYIEVSGDNGSTWTVIWENTDTLSGGSWDLWELDITAQAAGSSQVKIRWGMGPTDGGWRYCGWNIDDVEIFAEVPCTQPTPTPVECVNHGDVNFDGEITAGDAQMAFQIALGSYSPTFEEACAADCNGDENVTAGDAQEIFLTALGSGSCADPL